MKKRSGTQRISCAAVLNHQNINMFYTTNISVTIWILNKNKKARVIKHCDFLRQYRDREDEILFMDLREIGEPFEKKYIQFSDEHIQDIAKTYHTWQQTIVDRIKLNEQLNQKLEETAQAIYKQWFVNFEFPISKEYAAETGKPGLEGKPYKSNGGKMIWNDELDREIPEGWEADSLTKVFTLSGGGTPKTDIPGYWGNDIPFFTGKDVTANYYTLSTEKSITRLGLSKCSAKLYPTNTTFVVSRGATTGVLALSATEMAMNQSCYAFLGKGDDSFFVHQTMLMIMSELKRSATGSTFNALVTRDYEEIKTIAPNKTHTVCFNKLAEKLYNFSLKKLEEGVILSDLLDTLSPK